MSVAHPGLPAGPCNARPAQGVARPRAAGRGRPDPGPSAPATASSPATWPPARGSRRAVQHRRARIVPTAAEPPGRATRRPPATSLPGRHAARRQRLTHRPAGSRQPHPGLHLDRRRRPVSARPDFKAKPSRPNAWSPGPACVGQHVCGPTQFDELIAKGATRAPAKPPRVHPRRSRPALRGSSRSYVSRRGRRAPVSPNSPSSCMSRPRPCGTRPWCTPRPQTGRCQTPRPDPDPAPPT